jgi:uncharacterized protein
MERLRQPLEKSGAMRIVFAILLLLWPQVAVAAERIALVIGMGDYQTVVKLRNTVNDARDLSDTLAGIGFHVTTVIDAGGDELRSVIDDFAFRAETADLALIYFAGHGVEVQGENFLIPIDADVQTNRDIQRQAVSLTHLLASVERARKMRIVILDSCRDNPFGGALDLVELEAAAEASAQTRSISDVGLAPPSPDRGTMVAFAARHGERALDGIGDNSPFAEALMAALPTEGLEISLMFRQVRDQVMQATFNMQEPHTYGSLPGTPFYIAGDEGDDSAVRDEDLRVAWSDIRPDQEQQLASLADQGDTRSMLGLAYMRLNPEDARYAPSEAVRLLTRAAEEGSPEAQFELAKLYESGIGVAPDPQRALALYQSAADQGFADAINDLGFLYFQGGLGLPRDPAEAIAHFERAADLRHPEAMFNYAALIDDGIVPGKGPLEAGNYLYQSLRTGNAQVFEVLRDNADVFGLDTRKAFQAKLAEFAFYEGELDGEFGEATQRAVRLAYGLPG